MFNYRFHIFYQTTEVGDSSPTFFNESCYGSIYDYLDKHENIELYLLNNTEWKNYTKNDYQVDFDFTIEEIEKYTSILREKLDLKFTIEYNVKDDRFEQPVHVVKISNENNHFRIKFIFNCIRYMFELYGSDDSYQRAVRKFLSLVEEFPEECAFNLLNLALYNSNIQCSGHNHIFYRAYQYIDYAKYLEVMDQEYKYDTTLTTLFLKVEKPIGILKEKMTNIELINKYKELCQ